MKLTYGLLTVTDGNATLAMPYITGSLHGTVTYASRRPIQGLGAYIRQYLLFVYSGNLRDNQDYLTSL